MRHNARRLHFFLKRQREAWIRFKFTRFRFNRVYWDGEAWHSQRGFRIWFFKWGVRDEIKPDYARYMPGGKVKKDSSPIS